VTSSGTKTFQAKAIDPTQNGRTISGLLELDQDVLRFTSGPEKAVTLPLHEIKIRRGGFNDLTLFFEAPSAPGWVVYTEDASILNQPQWQNFPEFAGMARKMKTHRPRSLIAVPLVLIGLFLLLIAGVVWALIASRSKIVASAAKRVPVAWEEKIANGFRDDLQAKGKLITNAPRVDWVTSITNRLLQGIGQTDYRFQFHIVSDTNINAFAVPGGGVFINTGLLQAAGSPEEVAGVLAHEIAHVTYRHGTRNILESAGLFLLAQFLLGDTSGIVAILADSSRYLLTQKFSRDFEREADSAGWDYLVAAEIDPKGMLEFFKRLKAIEGKAGDSTAVQLINTHPATAERISFLEKKNQTVQGRTFRPLLPNEGNGPVK
jgi:Zn-dependent protease with chaperone function